MRNYFHNSHVLYWYINIWATARQNQQNDLCAQQRIKWAWAVESLAPLAAQKAHSEDWCPGWSESFAGRTCHFVGFVIFIYFAPDQGLVAPLAEWLRPLIFSALNRSSSYCCGFEPRSGHMWDKPSSACGWSGSFSRGSHVFVPPNYWLGSKWVK